jgi:hypothetical protein
MNEGENKKRIIEEFLAADAKQKGRNLGSDISSFRVSEGMPRDISEVINAILSEALLRGKGMFGTMPKTSLKNLRDHRDRAHVL